MSKDKNERKHRRTPRHPEAMAMMAKANFDAVRPLAEAMGLTPPPLEFVEGKMATSQDMKGERRAVWLAEGEFVVCVVSEGADIERSAAAMKRAAHATQVLPDLLTAAEELKAAFMDGCGEATKGPKRERLVKAGAALDVAIANARGTP